MQHCRHFHARLMALLLLMACLSAVMLRHLLALLPQFSHPLLLPILVLVSVLALCGSAVAAHFLGRRYVMIYAVLLQCLVVFAAGPALPSLATWMLLCLLLMALACQMVMCPIWLSEMVVAKQRGRWMVIYPLTLGMVSSVLAMSHWHLRQIGGWSYVGMCLLALLCLILLAFTCPESPRWLMMRGRNGQAVQSLLLTRSLPRARRDYQRLREAYERDLWPYCCDDKTPWWRYMLLSVDRFRQSILLVCLLLVLQTLLSVNSLALHDWQMTFAITTLPVQTHFIWQPVVGFLTVILCLFCDVWGRRPLLQLGMLLLMLGTACLVVASYLSLPVWFSTLAVSAQLMGAMIAPTTMMTVILPECLPDRLCLGIADWPGAGVDADCCRGVIVSWQALGMESAAIALVLTANTSIVVVFNLALCA